MEPDVNDPDEWLYEDSIGNVGFIRENMRFPKRWQNLNAVKIANDTSSLAVGFDSGLLQVRSFWTKKEWNVRESYSPVSCLKYNPNFHHILYATNLMGRITVYDIENKTCYTMHEVSDEINAMDINDNGNLLVCAGRDANLRFYDIRTGELTDIIGPQLLKNQWTDNNFYHKMRIHAVRFHPVTTFTLVSGGADDCLKVWDLRSTNMCIKTIKGPHITGPSLDFFKKYLACGEYVASGGLKIYDMSNDQEGLTVTPKNNLISIYGDFIIVVKMFQGSPFTEDVVCVGHKHGQVNLICLSKTKVIHTFESGGLLRTMDSCCNYVAFGGHNGKFILAEFDL